MRRALHSYRDLAAQLDKARDTQREALDNLQHQVRDLTKLVLRSQAAEPNFVKAVADFKMWVSRIEDEVIHEAASEYFDRCGEFETRLAEQPYNWAASAAPVIEAKSKLIDLTGYMISKLPQLYAPPGIEEMEHPDASAE